MDEDRAMTIRLRIIVITAASLAFAPVPAFPDSTSDAPVVRDRSGAIIHTLDPAPGRESTAPSATSAGETLSRASQCEGYWVDARGDRHPGIAPATVWTTDFAPGSGIPAEPLATPPPLANVTIDRMTTSTSSNYTPYREFRMLGRSVDYFLSDGTSWRSGAGSSGNPYAIFHHAETSGDTIRYHLVPQPDSLLYSQTDYDSGDHSSQGSLVAASPLVIEAIAGSRTAVLRGHTRIRDNDMTWYGEPAFKFFSSIPGSVVPFTVTYTIASGSWAFDTFDHPFSCTGLGEVDFAHPVSTPPLLELTLRGPSRIPPSSSIQFGAVARFAGEIYRDVRNRSSWSVSSATSASVFAGLLAMPPITTSREDLQLSATYHAGTLTREAGLTVSCIADIYAPPYDAWPMYQADIAHTGYRPAFLDPGSFTPRWSRTVGSGLALNPVTAADGMVFCSLVGYFPPAGTQQLFALSAADGATLWSTGYGSVFSVNPPSYAYGNVYVQTGNHSTDTYLHALDAASGTPIFSAPHSAQWERYYAPTVSLGKVYVNGGTYGGMYQFDAFSGTMGWFNGSLPQYDEWTPALDDSNAYAYLGEYAPGLYVVSRATGALRFSILDAGFGWNGWSMDGTAVVCGNGDVIAIQAGRLLCFNVPTHQLRWQLARAFNGQPSFAFGVIYAIDGGHLVAIDEATHTDLWSWTPPAGSLTGAMIVTDSHVFASTASTTFAVSLATRQSEWSYPAGGALALGNHALYVATSGGVLHAIDVADRPVATTLLRFDGESLPDGVHLRWEFADPREVAQVNLERATSEAGSWSRLTVDEMAEDGPMTALDTDVEPGRTYWYRLSVRFMDGTLTDFAPVRVTTVVTRAVDRLRILGPMPAPGAVTIEYALARGGPGRLAVRDVAGRVVASLADGLLEPGEHVVRWTSASTARAGVYFVTLDVPGWRMTKRIVLAR